MRKNRTCLVIALISLLAACKNPDLTPVYIHVTPEDFENCIDVSNYNETHSQNFSAEQLDALTHHKFTHVNVYVNNKNLGCWELPCNVPVLNVNDLDSCTLILIPGFQMSGMANTISGYPFFNILRQKVLLKKGTTYEVSQNPPKFVYNEYTQIPYFETFTNSTSFTPTDTISHTINFEPTIFEGRNVGEIILNDAVGQHFDVASKKITLPIGSYRTLLEIRYKTEGDIDVGMKISTGTNSHTVHSIGGFYASPDEWKTIHFDLSSSINGFHSTSSSYTDITLVLSGIGETGKTTRFEIDDIKVIYIRTA